MPITAYVGLPRSGKSYEVVKSVIVPSIAHGRRVISNIYGLNEEKIKAYCLKQYKRLTPEKLGSLVLVDNNQCLDEHFLPSMENQSTFCQAGDLVVIDEVWRVWGSDKDIPKNHRSFIAEHGHFINKDTGVMSDLIVINQSVTDIPRFLKARIDTTYRMQKHVSIGWRNSYRVDVFQGTKITKSNRMNYFQEKYDKAIFELYKSVEGSNPVTLMTDKRQSVFSSTRVLTFIISVPVLIFLSIYYGLVAYSDKTASKQQEFVNSTNNSSNLVVNLPISKGNLVLSEKWRITGELIREGKAYVILADKQGRLRLEPRSQFQYSGRLLQGEIDGQLVNYYSGGLQ
ncbi:hypothetical protein FE392_04020 [Xenorhabdus sp. 12]|uniref:Zona occludens toxin N-terminal domain-containing protein n=1 Tax=Xenorhabdus santafensis TaxID=2582833 RepID=A0ABU4S5L7_9GAMM|nr:zonular occludens toxin domain-containing protein [Xenorhabdus sp. 12]MDX7986503.1 hypothetical protein [Xenorhabdus sp. 12]